MKIVRSIKKQKIILHHESYNWKLVHVQARLDKGGVAFLLDKEGGEKLDWYHCYFPSEGVKGWFVISTPIDAIFEEI